MGVGVDGCGRVAIPFILGAGLPLAVSYVGCDRRSHTGKLSIFYPPSCGACPNFHSRYDNSSALYTLADFFCFFESKVLCTFDMICCTKKKKKSAAAARCTLANTSHTRTCNFYIWIPLHCRPAFGLVAFWQMRNRVSRIKSRFKRGYPSFLRRGQQ